MRTLSFIVSIIFTCSLLSQSILPTARITYIQWNNQLVPNSKVEFQYDNDKRRVAQLFYVNDQNTIKPRWSLQNRKNVIYEDDDTISKISNFSYYPLAPGQKESVISFEWSSEDTYNSSGELAIALSKNISYAENGEVTSFYGNRTIYEYDQNGCVTRSTTARNDDPSLPENKWKESSYSIRTNNFDCSFISFNRYTNDILESTYRSERNQNDQLTFEERTFSYSDIENRQTTTSTFQYDFRNRLTHFSTKGTNGRDSILFLFEQRHSYNKRSLKDTTWYEVSRFRNPEEGVFIFKYDDKDRIIMTEEYKKDSSDQLILASSNESIFGVDDQVINRVSYDCNKEELCTERATTFTYNSNGEVVFRETTKRSIENGIVYSIETDYTENIFRCDDLSLEQVNGNELSITSKEEWIYPIKADCEGLDISANTKVTPNPTYSQFQIWSPMLNGLKTDVTITDMAGEIIWQGTTENRTLFGLDHLELVSGAYTATLSRGSVIVSKKIIVTN